MNCRYPECNKQASDSGWCQKHDLNAVRDKAKQDSVAVVWNDELQREVERIVNGGKVSDVEKFKLLEKRLWQLAMSSSTKVSLDASTKLAAMLKLRREMEIPDDSSDEPEQVESGGKTFELLPPRNAAEG